MDGAIRVGSNHRRATMSGASNLTRTRRAYDPHLGPGQIVLVFQGGGALGAYQAGVYQALHEAGIEPDWIIGTSIGAINASLIAGNAPGRRLARLKEFWDRMAHKMIWSGSAAWPQMSQTLSYWSTLAQGIPGYFEPNPMAFWGTHMLLGADRAGYYSTAPLERTQGELVDFPLVNRCKPRLTVGAAHVRSSQMKYFDSRDMKVNLKKVRELAGWGCLARMHVVRLLAPRLTNEDHTKDVDFSPSGIRKRWEAGHADALRALERKQWHAGLCELA